MLKIDNKVTATGPGVYGFRMVKNDHVVWVSVGRTNGNIKVRTAEYVDGKWFCCDNKNGKSVTAEFAMSCFIGECLPLGWRFECIQLDEDPENEFSHWQKLQPVLQRRSDGRRAQFTKELKLSGRAPEVGFEDWYVEGCYGNKGSKTKRLAEGSLPL